jgi:hypothetical protein
VVATAHKTKRNTADWNRQSAELSIHFTAWEESGKSRFHDYAHSLETDTTVMLKKWASPSVQGWRFHDAFKARNKQQQKRSDTTPSKGLAEVARGEIRWPPTQPLLKYSVGHPICNSVTP